MRYLLILVICSRVWCQQNANIPNLAYSYITPAFFSPDWTVPLPDGTAVNDLIDVCVAVDRSAGSGPYAATDTLGNTYTTTTPTDNGTTIVYHAYTVSSSAGANTVSIAIPAHFFYGLVAGVYRNFSGTVDGAVATATTSSAPASLSTSKTTAVNGDLRVICASGDGSGHKLHISPNMQFVGTSENIVLGGFANSGIAGSYTDTVLNADGPNTRIGMQTLAFKPSSITIVTSALDNCAVGVACKENLSAIGGVGAYTWSLSSGSCAGMSITDATNGIYSGTPTTPGACSLTFQVTDGITPTTKSLTLNIGATFGTPVIRQSLLAQNLNVGSFPLPVLANSILCAIGDGFDTDGSSGWVQNDSGATNNVQDTFGDTLKRMRLTAGVPNAPAFVYCGHSSLSGSTGIRFNKTTAGSTLSWGLIEVCNLQLPDETAFNAGVGQGLSSPYTVTTSVATQVPNEIVLGFATVEAYGFGTDISINPPFSTMFSSSGFYDSFAVSRINVAGAGTQSATATVNSSVGYGIASSQLSLIPFRPDIFDAGCVVPTAPLGEKHRRQIY